MNACGQTMVMISCNTNSFAAEVLMLNPARSSSSAIVAVPPLDDALVDAPLVMGDTTTSDIVTAPAARAANADRFNNPFSPIAIACSPTAPVTAASHPSHPVGRGSHPSSLGGRRLGKRNVTATFCVVQVRRISA